MLQVQQFLREHGLAELVSKYAIRVTEHPVDPLVILNYDQISSRPKDHPIVRECRGLTLELGTWYVVARSFTRFFNAGEARDIESKFDWNSFTVESKEDGSLMMLYRYKGTWRINTRGSFALGDIFPGVGKTWEEAFYLALDEVGLDDLIGRYQDVAASTLVFEFCSPWNKVVRRYDKPTLFLLTGCHNSTGHEWNDFKLDRVASDLGVKRPSTFTHNTLKGIQEYLETQDDPTFEGVVLRDRRGLRIKVKNSRYVALHHMHDNGNLFHPKRLLPFVLKGEQGEVLSYFPELAEPVFDMSERLFGVKGRLEAVWQAAKGIEKQKDFALFVTKHAGPMSSLLFTARKQAVEPNVLFRDAGDSLLKHYFSRN